VRAGGGTVDGLGDSPDALVWLVPRDPDGLREVVAAAPTARWVQLPFAGVENFLGAGVLTPDRTWTCAKGVYSEPTAEHALALILAALRRLPEHARATTWGGQGATSLYGARVLILGGGGITGSLLELLAPFRVEATVVRRSPDPVAGAVRTVTPQQLDEVLPEATVVVLALALTPETELIIGRPQLQAMNEQAVLVNVARGRHVDTEALVEALAAGSIAGAAIDVPDPEPLPPGHPVWTEPRCLITPHTANPWPDAQSYLYRRITENVRRFCAGEPLLGLVDLSAGY
jgi:phosphoglycerate dehydrogenase-like enzyme